jgi:hypothetical protein
MMSNNQQHQASITTKKTMTRKEALGILHQFFLETAYTTPRYELTSEQKEHRDTLRQQSWNAFEVLARAVHGPCDWTQHFSLCEICHIRYTQHFPQIKDEVIGHRLAPCCTTCLERLRVEGVLYEEKNEGNHE